MKEYEKLKEVARNTKGVLKILKILAKPDLDPERANALTHMLFDIVTMDLLMLEEITEVNIINPVQRNGSNLVSMAKTRTALMLEAARRYK